MRAVHRQAPEFSVEGLLNERVEYVVVNGLVDTINTACSACQAGERVRLFALAWTALTAMIGAAYIAWVDSDAMSFWPAWSQRRANYHCQHQRPLRLPPSRHGCRRRVGSGGKQTPQHEGAADVQNEHQTLSPGSIAGQTAETYERQTPPGSILCPYAPPGQMTQNRSTSALIATIITSNGPKGAGKRPEFSRAPIAVEA
jgi:hypothetical protein